MAEHNKIELLFNEILNQPPEDFGILFQFGIKKLTVNINTVLCEIEYDLKTNCIRFFLGGYTIPCPYSDMADRFHSLHTKVSDLYNKRCIDDLYTKIVK